jgi:hypothetical protein
MDAWSWTLPLAILLGLIVVALAWRPLKRWSGQINVERAKELFVLQRERLEPNFLPAAAASGKPRGLRWVHCQFDGDVEFARDRTSKQLVALLQVTVQFEAIAGSDMEGVAAVSNLRNASAVFFFHAGQWHTAGKAVFNMNPREALHHFRNQYEPVLMT